MNKEKISLGFIKPNYNGEKRVAIIPEHILQLDTNIIIEKGFGEHLGIQDDQYLKAGAKTLNRKEIFSNCDILFSLKLIQETDYSFIRKFQTIIGWTHPYGSGANFIKKQAIPKSLTIIDLDNIYPRKFIGQEMNSIDLKFIPKNFVWRNSFISGISAVNHALLSHGMLPNDNHSVAILSSGNVAQGAFYAASKYTSNIRLFYRKTMDQFIDQINQFDIIINGIELDNNISHIITKKDLKRTKLGVLIIDAAADAENVIEGSRYTTIEKPIYEEDKRFFYVVSNCPSIYHRESSEYLSKQFTKYVYNSKQLKKIIDA